MGWPPNDPASLVLVPGHPVLLCPTQPHRHLSLGTQCCCVRPSLTGACPWAPSAAVSDPASLALVPGHPVLLCLTQPHWHLSLGTQCCCVRPSLTGACPWAPSAAVSDPASYMPGLGHLCLLQHRRCSHHTSGPISRLGMLFHTL